MTPEKLFHELLGLGLNWRVQECEFKREKGVVLLVICETEHLWESERLRCARFLDRNPLKKDQE